MARYRTKSGRFAKRPARRRRTRARRRTYRRNPGVADLMLMNPPRKRRRRSRKVSRRRSYARRARRYASKSLLPSVKGIMGTVQEGAFLAAGSVLVSQVMARFVPDTLKAGPQKHLVRLGVAILGGRAVSKFVSPKLGHAFTLGGVMSTVLIAANEYLGGAIAPLGGMDELALGAYYAAPGVGGLNAYYTPGMVSAQPDFLGYESDIPERLSPANRF